MTAVVETASDTTEVLGLEPDKARGAILLASGMAIGRVAAEIGVDRSTLFHWRQEPTFGA